MCMERRVICFGCLYWSYIVLALLYAGRKGNEDAMRVLLGAGAIPSIAGKSGDILEGNSYLSIYRF